MTDIPTNEKYTLSVKDAASYFDIDEAKMRNMAQEGAGTLSVQCGRRILVLRERFEQMLTPEQKGENRMGNELRLNEKYALTIKEAAAYFNIGTVKMRRLAVPDDEDDMPPFSVNAGNRFLIIRPVFEQYMLDHREI